MRGSKLIGCVAGLVLAWGCGDDAKSGATDASVDADAASSADAASGGDAGAKADASTGTGAGSCLASAGKTKIGTCSDTEVAAYNACVDQTCATQYATCYGPDHAAGKFAGPCAAYLTCESDCNCDAGCSALCKPATECTTCLVTIGQCALGCRSQFPCTTMR
jgi:hypothetical protein